jgi:hypothetical protein
LAFLEYLNFTKKSQRTFELYFDFLYTLCQGTRTVQEACFSTFQKISHSYLTLLFSKFKHVGNIFFKLLWPSHRTSESYFVFLYTALCVKEQGQCRKHASLRTISPRKKTASYPLITTTNGTLTPSIVPIQGFSPPEPQEMLPKKLVH